MYISPELRICKKGLRCQEMGLEVDFSSLLVPDVEKGAESKLGLGQAPS